MSSILLEKLELMRCVLLCILETLDGGFYLREFLEGLKVPVAMLCMLLRLLEAVEGRSIWCLEISIVKFYYHSGKALVFCRSSCGL